MVTHRPRSFAALSSLACISWMGCQSDASDATSAWIDQAAHGHSCDWTQWGGASDHGGDSCAQGQPIARELAHVTIDPFVDQETAELAFPGFDGVLDVHYQVPLIDGDDVFVLKKAGTYVSCDPPGSGEPFPCGPDNLGAQTWTEQALRWHHGQLEPQWTFVTDWKTPERGSETMFQPVLTQHDIYIAGFGGSVFRVNRHNGHLVERIQPFGPSLDPNTFVWGGLAANRDGDVYYNAVKLDPAKPFGDVLGAWIVKVSKHGCVTVADYSTINPSAPAPDSMACYQTFRQMVPRPPFPWPPPPQPDGSPTLPPAAACGHQRAGENQIPAIGPDGTVFVATHGQAIHGNHFVLALKPDLSLKWAASLGGHLNDACGVNADFECREGTPLGIEDQTNQPPEGRVIDASSASPVALPDGGVIYGAYTAYNNVRGHLMRFDRDGAFTGSYTFGWDETPAVWQHDGTYSVVTKDNHYFFDEEFYITQLDANLVPEWTHEATNPLTCERQPDGTIECHDDGSRPNGFEWCTNAPVVDRAGHVYVTNGDGNLYVIGQDGNEITHWFLDKTRAASYTPGAIDREGRIYAMNNGELFVLGQ